MQPEDPNSALPAHLVAELLELRPDIERILADEPRSSRRFCANLEDKVQTVLLKALRHLPTYRPHEDGLKPWVTRIACNLNHDAHRSKQRRDETFSDGHVDTDHAPAASLSPERAVQWRSLMTKVLAAIAELPPNLQEVLILSAFAGKSHADIADNLDISKDAVKMRLVRAREYIRKKVGAIDDHIGVVPVTWLLARRSMRFLGQMAHLLPPIFVGISTLPQWEPITPMAEPAKMVIAASTSEPTTQPTIDTFAPNWTVVDVPTPISAPTQQSPRKQRKSKPFRRQYTFDVVVPHTPDLMSDKSNALVR